MVYIVRKEGNFPRSMRKRIRRIGRTYKTYNTRELLGILIDFRALNGRLPTMYDFSQSASYQSPSTYRDRFGSWKHALELISSEKILNSVGRITTSDDGHSCQSSMEHDLDNLFYKNLIVHGRNISYPRQARNGMTCDFSLPSLNVWIEVIDKLDESNYKDYEFRLKRKKEIALQNNMNLLFIRRDDYQRLEKASRQGKGALEKLLQNL